MLLFIICLTALTYAQQESENTDPAEPGAYETVDESSLLLFPDEGESQQGTTDARQDTQEPVAPSSVGAADLLRVLVVLAGVIAVIYLLVYFLRKFSPLAENQEEQISLLATRHLKKDTSLHIVEVGNQVFLIGSGSNTVSLISEITDQETIDRIHLDASSAPEPSENSFRSLIRKGFSGAGGNSLRDGSPDFLRSQRDRLKNLRGEE